MSGRIKLKRVYESPEKSDGARILVDRLWPRGLSKEKARIDHWAKDVSPSNELRKWYGHEPARWKEFKERYAAELDEHPDAIRDLLVHMDDVVTFLFSSKELELNNARALRDYLESRKLVKSRAH